MKISIITACFNAQDTIEETIRSVAKQTYDNIEYIIVDGASKDGTLDIIKDCSKKQSITWISEPDIGIYDAMNKGISKATGEVVTFLNAGDIYIDGTVIADVVERMTAEPGHLLFCGGVYGLSADRKHLCDANVTYKVLDKYFFFFGTIPHQATFYRREIFDICGPFDPHFMICGDHEFFVRCLVRHQISVKKVDVYITKYDLGGISHKLESMPVIKEEIDRIRNAHYTAFERWLYTVDMLSKDRRGRRLRKILTLLGIGAFKK